MRTLFILLLIYSAVNVAAQGLSNEKQKKVYEFISEVKHQEIQKLSSRVRFPLKRQYPIPSVKNRADFTKRYHEIFDEKLTKMISDSKPESDWSEVGWRGIMLHNGVLWLDDGWLIAVNYQSKAEKAMREKLIKTDKAGLHPSLRNFEKPINLIKTPKYRIRIDDLGKGNYRYSSWPVHTGVSDKPDIVIVNGKQIIEGNIGNDTFKFKNLEYTYNCQFIMDGVKDPYVKVLIYKGARLISSENGRIIN